MHLNWTQDTDRSVIRQTEITIAVANDIPIPVHTSGTAIDVYERPECRTTASQKLRDAVAGGKLPDEIVVPARTF